MAETYLSRSLLEDAAVDIVGELATAYAEAQGIDEDNRFITGTGARVPRGILIAGTTPETGVTTVNSGSAAALTADGVIDLQYGIASQYRGRGVFVANRSTAAVIRKFKDGMGQYLWQPSYQEGKPDMLLGRPFLEQEVMPSVAAGTYPLMFGDPTGYRIVERVGMTVERFLGGSEARQDRVLYIMRRRLGGQLTNAERWAVQLVSA
jgi:HK97 family phage major capsid protein